MSTYGFIGTGNMGSALARAFCRKVDPQSVMLNDKAEDKAQTLSNTLSCQTGDLKKLVTFSSHIVLGVKPQMLRDLLHTLTPLLAKKKDPFILVSMVAGTSIETIEKLLGHRYPIIRIMPNMACSVGQGMTLCTANELVTADEFVAFREDLSASGRCDEVPEHLIDAGSAVSGCGPAYVFMMAEAMADGAVASGLPRDKAYLYAAQTLLGAAVLMLNSTDTPARLKDAVCSPGGTTIEGVAALEKAGFRSAVIEAVRAAYEKNSRL